MPINLRRLYYHNNSSGITGSGRSPLPWSWPTVRHRPSLQNKQTLLEYPSIKWAIIIRIYVDTTSSLRWHPLLFHNYCWSFDVTSSVIIIIDVIGSSRCYSSIIIIVVSSPPPQPTDIIIIFLRSSARYDSSSHYSITNYLLQLPPSSSSMASSKAAAAASTLLLLLLS